MKLNVDGLLVYFPYDYISGAVFLHVVTEEVFGCKRPFSPRNALRLERKEMKPYITT